MLLLGHILQMKMTTLHQDVGEFVCVVTARKNTWSNQRKLRRLEKRKQQRESGANQQSTSAEEKEVQEDDPSPPFKKPRMEDLNTANQGQVGESSANQESQTSAKANQDSLMYKSANQEMDSGESSCEETPPLITFSTEVLLEGLNIKLRMKLIGKGDKDMLHQILVYFKNRLK